MANGRFTLGKQSGGTLGLVFPDGVSNTEVVLPESGELATKAYVDNGDTFVANDNRIKTALNADGTAPIYACRAWVTFNGTGTVAIRASGNVSSITDGGVGQYTINFTTAMPDVNYSFSESANKGTDGGYPVTMNEAPSTPKTTTALRVLSLGQNSGFGYFDPSSASIQIIR